MNELRQKLAIVIGNVPTIDEIDQFMLVKELYDINVIASVSVCRYLEGVSNFQNLNCVALPDYDENPSYLPGLERVLQDYDIVVLKERLGLYAYQTIKAKWIRKFRLLVWVDNLIPFPAEDIDQLKLIRSEINRCADAFLVQSQAARTTLQLEGIGDERILSMVPWVLGGAERTAKSRAQALEALKLSESHLLVSYFGQLEWEEGLTDLLAAVKIAIDSDASLNRRLHVALCGFGSYDEDLAKMVTALGLTDRIHTIVPGRVMSAVLYEASDAIFLGSTPARDRVEGDPYRILIAMANRIPLIASRSPIIEEYCGKHRLDFCAKAPQSLAVALGKLLNAAAIRNDVVNRNYQYVNAHHNADLAANQMLQTLNMVSNFKATESTIDVDNQVLSVEVLVKNEQFLAAVDAIERIIKSPDVPLHHRANLDRLIGDCFVKLGDLDAGREAYLKALQTDPYAAKVQIGLGTLNLLKGCFDVAVPHFQKAVALSPNDENANLGLGLAFEGMGELKEAIRWINKSLELSPDNMSALFSIVKVSHKLDKFDDAIAAISSYLERNPTDWNIVYTLSGIQFKQGHYAEANTTLSRILRANPADTRALLLLEKIHAETQQKADVSSSNR